VDAMKWRVIDGDGAPSTALRAGSFRFAQRKLCRLTCVEQGMAVVIDGARVTWGAEQKA